MGTPSKANRRRCHITPYAPKKEKCQQHTRVAAWLDDDSHREFEYILLTNAGKQKRNYAKYTTGKHHCYAQCPHSQMTFENKQVDRVTQHMVNTVSRLHTSYHRSFDKMHLKAVHWEVNDIVQSVRHIMEDTRYTLVYKKKWQDYLDNILQLQELLKKNLKVKKRCPKSIFETAQCVLHVNWFDPTKKLFF